MSEAVVKDYSYNTLSNGGDPNKYGAGNSDYYHAGEELGHQMVTGISAFEGIAAEGLKGGGVILAPETCGLSLSATATGVVIQGHSLSVAATAQLNLAYMNGSSGPSNSKGVKYPDVKVEGYGKVPFPDGPYTPNNSTSLRGKFSPTLKKQFKNWWIEQGRKWPDGNVNIHHIKPLSKGGDNSFENLVPLLQPSQHQPFTNWWRNFP